MKAPIYVATRYSKLIFALLLLATLPLAHYAGLKTTHNTIDVFFEEGNEDLAFYHRFQDVYGNEERSLIVIEDEDIFTAENIEIVREISHMAREAEGVRRVISITEQNLPTGKEDTVYFEPLIPAGPLTPAVLERAREQAKASQLVNSLVLVAGEGSMTAIVAELEAMGSNEEKGALQTYLIDEARKIAGDKVQLRFTGVPIIENELNTLGKVDNEKFGPLTLLMVLVVVGLTLRRVGLTFLCLVNVVLVSIWSIGFYTYMGESMNLVTMMIPPVLIAVSVADSIHFLSRYQEISRKSTASRSANVRDVIRVLWLPCLLTSITTIVGFLSFVSSPVRPVQIVGVYMSIGVAIAYLLTFAFLPSALLLVRKDVPAASSQAVAAKGAGLLARIAEGTARFVIVRHKLIGLCTLLLLAFILTGVARIHYVTNFTNYMPADNPVKQDLSYLDEAYGGTVPIELTIRAVSPEHDFSNSESLQLVDKIQRDIMGHMQGDYTSSFSIADYFKSINQAFNGNDPAAHRIPENHLDVLDFYEIGEPDEIRALVSPDRMETRISFQCINGPFDINERLESFTDTYLPKVLGERYTYKFTGYGRLYVDMDRNLKESQINSLFLAFTLVVLIMFAIAGNLKLAVLTMLPNLFPVAMTLGMMGWLNIPFDVATIMVATMTLGIAVDDTIHYTVWFRRHRASGMDLDAAVLQTARDTGRPIILTSLVLFMGFSVMVLAQTLPLQYFGILTGMSMLFAVIGDLVLLPALILIFKPAAGMSTQTTEAAEAA